MKGACKCRDDPLLTGSACTCASSVSVETCQGLQFKVAVVLVASRRVW